jgi:hypothetical protein
MFTWDTPTAPLPATWRRCCWWCCAIVLQHQPKPVFLLLFLVQHRLLNLRELLFIAFSCTSWSLTFHDLFAGIV